MGRVRIGLASPPANHGTQLVCLLLELAHPLGLHGQIATDFCDLALNSIRQFGDSERILFTARAT